MSFANKPIIGQGIYTVPDLAEILNLKYYKVQNLLNEYWNKRFVEESHDEYSWTDGKSKAVNFYTLIEFYTFFQFKEAGVPTQKILTAHIELSKMFNTPFPFATSGILEGLGSVGKKIIFEFNDEEFINLDMTKQLNLKFIKEFISKIEFGDKRLAIRLWPLGKERTIVVDPEHQFGQPTIAGTNILPFTVYSMKKAKEPISFIADTYGISHKQINDAITYCKRTA